MATRGTSRAKPPTGPNSKATTSEKSGVDKCQVFYGSLSDKLDTLEQAVQPKRLTLEWISLAVDFMRSTFADMMILFEDVRTLMPAVKSSDEFWIEEYMVESMKLLDVCNVLKPAVSRFEHFTMCVQLVVPAIERCAGEGQEIANNETLNSALRMCETELNELLHPPLTRDKNLPRKASQSDFQPPDALLRFASITIGEIFTSESLLERETTLRRDGSARRRTVALALVMRATRETTDFVASVLVWALKRDPSTHPASTNWQQNLEVFRGEESLWSPSFRRLQERLRKELFEIVRGEQGGGGGKRQFVFEELKLVQEHIGLVQEHIGLVQAEVARPASSVRRLEGLVQQDLRGLLDTIRVRLERVSSQVSQLFDELVQARKKLLDAAQQRPGSIQRSHTL